MKNAARHLEFERIIGASESASANLSNDEQTHLANCSECSASHRKLTNLFALAPVDLPEIVPQSATANLLNIYRKPPAKPQKTLTSRLAALLVFDDWKPEFALNERLSFQDARQFLYRAGDYSIDLRLNFTDEKCLVSGQIFPDPSNAVVRIYNAKFSLESSLNDYGEFVFPLIEPENFNLQIVVGDETIEIENISVS